MPIEIHPDDDLPPIDVQPETNEAAVLGFLAKHPRTGFKAAALSDETGVSRESIYNTVKRLIKKDLAEYHADGKHIYINHDRRDAIYRRLRSFRDRKTFERVFDDDYFSNNPDWDDEFEDLGTEPLPEQVDNGSSTADDRDSDGPSGLPDLGKVE
jgi:predicted DNA-binding protein YlxM (UPF0122 family)